MRNILVRALCASAALIPIQQFAADTETVAGNKGKPNSQPQPAAIAAAPARKERISLIQIGANYTHVNIKPSTTPGLNGNLGGAQGMYEYHPLNSLYAGLKVMWRQGNTSGGGATRYLVDVDAHERIGYTFAYHNREYLFTPFTGFGYRYLGHKLTSGGATLKLDHNEFYIPVGFLTDFLVRDWFSGGLNLLWMPQVFTTVYLSPIGGVQWETKRKLANFLVELPLNFYMGSMNQFLIIVKPFYEYWQDGATTATTTSGIPLGIPENTYNFWGAELNFGFKF